MSGHYFKDWYERNKEDLNRRRREKYHTNPDYRKTQIQNAKKRYSEDQSRSVVADRRVLRNDDGQRFWSIGVLSETINRTIQTIRGYHRNDFIPSPTHYDSRGWRLYTSHQINLLQRVFRDFDERRLKNLSDVRRELYANWNGNDGAGRDN
jgi:hypothetical protein